MTEQARKSVRIITDGACQGNPGPGGWAAILIHGRHRKELWGSARHTTNNRMELAGAIEGLRALKQPCDVELVTDSEYLKNGITKWIHGWKQRGWLTASKTPVVNRELWERLEELEARHKVRWTWTKGHAAHEENNRADELATRAAATQSFSPGYRPDAEGPSYELAAAGRPRVETLL
jgi:ribonuclease HI